MSNFNYTGNSLVYIEVQICHEPVTAERLRKEIRAFILSSFRILFPFISLLLTVPRAAFPKISEVEIRILDAGKMWTGL